MRFCSRLSLTNTGPQAILALKQALDDEHWTIRLVVTRALGTSRPEAISTLRKALSDKYERVQHGAARATAEISREMAPAETRADAVTLNWLACFLPAFLCARRTTSWTLLQPHSQLWKNP